MEREYRRGKAERSLHCASGSLESNAGSTCCSNKRISNACLSGAYCLPETTKTIRSTTETSQELCKQLRKANTPPRSAFCSSGRRYAEQQMRSLMFFQFLEDNIEASRGDMAAGSSRRNSQLGCSPKCQWCRRQSHEIPARHEPPCLYSGLQTVILRRRGLHIFQKSVILYQESSSPEAVLIRGASRAVSRASPVNLPPVLKKGI